MIAAFVLEHWRWLAGVVVLVASAGLLAFVSRIGSIARQAVAPLAPTNDERRIKVEAAKARAAAATDVYHAHEVLTHDEKLARLNRDLLGRK